MRLEGLSGGDSNRRRSCNVQVKRVYRLSVVGEVTEGEGEEKTEKGGSKLVDQNMVGDSTARRVSSKSSCQILLLFPLVRFSSRTRMNLTRNKQPRDDNDKERETG